MSVFRAIHLKFLRLFGSPPSLVEHACQLAARGNHRQAVDLFVQAAKAGSSAACLELGRAYLFGIGLPHCAAAALHWLDRAAVGGVVEAQFMIASLALQGHTHSPSQNWFENASGAKAGAADYPMALRWVEQAASSGHAPSQALLGFILTSGPPALRDVRRGDDCYRRAADAGCAHGQLGWSLALLRADPVANADDARSLLTEAARADLPIAHYLLGVLAGRDSPASEAAPEMAAHFLAGARLGHAPSQLACGLALLHGDGVRPDAFQGESWIRRAALAGEVEAFAALGELYGQSAGGAADTTSPLPPNFAEAMLWFGRASASGHMGAACALARLHLQNIEAGADRGEALRLLRGAAELGDQAACDELAAVVLANRSIASSAGHDESRAILAWFRQRATQGDPAAAYNVGVCCVAGIGMAANDAEALPWFRIAAEHLPIAQYSCGLMLVEGRGAAQDLVAGRRLLLQASEQGLPEAEALAGEMLLNGRGGPADLGTAKILFRQAAEGGHAGALYALGLMALGYYQEPEDPQAAKMFLRRAAEQGHAGAMAALAARYPARDRCPAAVQPQAIDAGASRELTLELL